MAASSANDDVEAIEVVHVSDDSDDEVQIIQEVRAESAAAASSRNHHNSSGNSNASGSPGGARRRRRSLDDVVIVNERRRPPPAQPPQVLQLHLQQNGRFGLMDYDLDDDSDYNDSDYEDHSSSEGLFINNLQPRSVRRRPLRRAAAGVIRRLGASYRDVFNPMYHPRRDGQDPFHGPSRGARSNASFGGAAGGIPPGEIGIVNHGGSFRMVFPSHRDHGSLPGGARFVRGDEEIDQGILNLIERREEAERDRVISKNLLAVEGVEKDLNQRLENLPQPFTSTIKEDEDYVCPLCNVVLGEGIPELFVGNKQKLELSDLQSSNDCKAPYEAMNLVTDADRDLSKRVFVSTCGHTYCGRCVRNFSSVKSHLKNSKFVKKRKTENDIENPFVYAPSRCTVDGCNATMVAKKRFHEVYL